MCTVVTYNLGRCLPITIICVALGGRQGAIIFPATVLRSSDTATANSVFSTGNVVIVGCANENDGLMAAHMLVDLIYQRTGIDCSVLNFNVCNMVYRVELPFAMQAGADASDPNTPGGLNLDLLYSDAKVMAVTDWDRTKKKQGVSYNPAKFPGLAWRIHYKTLRATLTMFTTGKGVGTGVRMAHQRHLLNEFLGTLGKFERGNEYRPIQASQVKRKRLASADPDDAKSNRIKS